MAKKIIFCNKSVHEDVVGTLKGKNIEFADIRYKNNDSKHKPCMFIVVKNIHKKDVIDICGESNIKQIKNVRHYEQWLKR